MLDSLDPRFLLVLRLHLHRLVCRVSEQMLDLLDLLDPLELLELLDLLDPLVPLDLPQL